LCALGPEAYAEEKAWYLFACSAPVGWVICTIEGCPEWAPPLQQKEAFAAVPDPLKVATRVPTVLELKTRTAGTVTGG